MYFVILASILNDFSADFSHHMSPSGLQLSVLPVLTPYGSTVHVGTLLGGNGSITVLHSNFM